MNKSESIGALAKSLIGFQNDFGSIDKNSKVDVKNKDGKFLYSFNYTTLDHIIETARPHLKKHGLAFSQFVSDGGITTILMHESGEFIEDFASLSGIKYNTAQELGSAITYVRRYALASALGIAADEDDDGNVNAGNDYTRQGMSNGAASQALYDTNLTGKILDAAKQLWGDGPHYEKLDEIIMEKAGRKMKVKDLNPTQQQQLLSVLEKHLGVAE